MFAKLQENPKLHPMLTKMTKNMTKSQIQKLVETVMNFDRMIKMMRKLRMKRAMLKWKIMNC